MRLHTGAKPFKCPHCDLRFRTSGHRKSHMTTHLKGTVELRQILNDEDDDGLGLGSGAMRLVFNSEAEAAASTGAASATNKFQLFEQQDGTVVLSAMDPATNGFDQMPTSVADGEAMAAATIDTSAQVGKDRGMDLTMN